MAMNIAVLMPEVGILFLIPTIFEDGYSPDEGVLMPEVGILFLIRSVNL